MDLPPNYVRKQPASSPTFSAINGKMKHGSNSVNSGNSSTRLSQSTKYISAHGVTYLSVIKKEPLKKIVL